MNGITVDITQVVPRNMVTKKVGASGFPHCSIIRVVGLKDATSSLRGHVKGRRQRTKQRSNELVQEKIGVLGQEPHDGREAGGAARRGAKQRVEDC